MIDDEQNGLLIDAGDGAQLAVAMRRLAGDEQLRVRMGAAARARAEQFTASSCVPRFEALYEQTIEAGRRRL